MAPLCSSKSGVLHVTFNQDCTCVAIGSQQGVHIYNADTHKLCYRHAIGAVSIVEMLFCSSLVGFVGAGEQPALTPRKLTVMNTSASRIIQELTYPSSVLAVRMNRQRYRTGRLRHAYGQGTGSAPPSLGYRRLVVLTAKRAHVYSMQNLACLRTVETEDATQGCCALTTCHEPNLLALPSSATTGTVRIYDLAHEGGNVLSEVQAHQTPVVCLAWNGDGSLLATASTKGTVLRVHRMPSAARSHSFRRGTLAASIQSLAFGPPGLPAQLLVAASSHGTVHVFRLEEPELPGALPKPASAAAGLLSAVMRYSVGDMVEPARNIATIRLPPGVVQATCAFRQAPLPPDPADAQIGGTEDALPSSPSDAARAQGMGLAGPGMGLASVGSGEARSPPSRSTSVGGAGYGGGGGAAAAAAEARAVIMVATQEGLLYEYSLSDLLNPQGPKCSLEGEWAMLGSGSVLG